MGEQTDKAASCAAGSLLPSASADGKREPTATRQTSFVSSLINHHLFFN